MHGHGMTGYHQRVYIPLNTFIQYFMNISKDIILLCCYFKIVAHTIERFIDNVKDECGDDQYLDEEFL